MIENNRYTVGKNIPFWVKNEIKNKNIKIYYDCGEIDYVMVKTSCKVVYAGKGDVILKNDEGLVVVQ